MSKVQKYGGTWRLFEKEEIYQGELHINHEKNIIALVLTIPASEDMPMPSIPYKGKIPYIHGTLISGAKVLLYKCSTGKEHNKLMSHTQQIIYVDYAFWGLQIDSEEEMIFNKATFDFGEIIEWSGLCSYDWEFTEEGGDILKWSKHDPVVFDLSKDLQIKFLPSQGEKQGFMYGKETKINQYILVQFLYKNPVKWETIMEDSLCIQYLIGLGINRRVDISKVRYCHSSIYYEQSNYDNGTMEKINRYADMFIGTGIPNSNYDVSNYGTRRHYFLYMLDDFVKNDSFIKWRENYSKLKPVLDLYFTSFSDTGTAEMLFLNITQALETYHARFITDNIKEYINRIDKMLEEDTSDQWKKFLIDTNQRKSKRIFLRSRLADLIFAEGILPFWPNDFILPKYVKKIVDTRNYYTHYNSKLLDKAFSKKELPFINGHLLALLEYHLLVLIGFDRNEVRKKTVRRISEIDSSYEIQRKTHLVKK